MAETLADCLVVAISSRALFDLEESHRVFTEQGLEAYASYQIQHEDDLPPDRGWDDIPGFENVVPISLEAYRAILSRIHGWRYPE